MDTISFLIGKKAGGGSPAPTPTYQDKEITISTNGTQTVSADSGYDALNSVEITTNVPQPSGKITITQNGTYIDVSSYASADVNVPADLTPYFYTTETAGTQNFPSWFYLIKKLPPITVEGTSMAYFFGRAGSGVGQVSPPGCLMEEIPIITNFSNITDFQYAFLSCKRLVNVDLSNRQFNSNITNIRSMFSECTELKKINLSSLTSLDDTTTVQLNSLFYNCDKLEEVDLSNLNNTGYISINQMFYKCSSLQKADISSLDFSKISGTFSNMLNSVPTDCLILVKDQTAKDWFTTNFSDYTNVQIKSEYLANQGA